MSALPKSELPDDFRNELARLARAGFPLIPLGAGGDGKAPMAASWAGPPLALRRVLGPLYRAGSQVYGVRLDDLAVIDCDEDNDDLVAAMEVRFGPSPVHVKTPRGRHLYYRAKGKAPNLRSEGLPVDIKTGPRAYVVGPLSKRPDGGLYLPAKGTLGKDALPLLGHGDGPQSAIKGEEHANQSIPVGDRHNNLVKAAVQMVEVVDSLEELAANLEGVRDDLCADVSTMPDSELRAIAKWAWECRLDNRIYKGRNSAFSLERSALDALRGWENEVDAIALYVMLKDQHGHTPGKRFALDFKSMRASGLTQLSIRRLRDARRTLEKVGLLALVGKHRAGAMHQTFTLCRLNPDSAAVAANVAPLTGPRVVEKEGGKG